MNIGIIGGGSIGLLFAYYLNPRFPVTVYTRTIEQANIINQEGLLVKDLTGKLQKTSIQAKAFCEWSGLEELSIVTVKQYQLTNVLEKMSKFSGKNKSLLFLQNGMGHLRKIKKLLDYNLYVGSVEHGSYREGANLVKHNGQGVTRVAVFRGDDWFLTDLTKKTPSNFPVIMESNYYEMLVKKLVVNAMINPLTAVLKVPNGALVENPDYFIVLQNLFAEISNILNLENKEVYFEHTMTVCKNTATNRSSMLKDLERNQETEIEAILGFLLEEASLKGVEAPLVACFYQLVKGLERPRRGNEHG